jgi:hypothetical protein
LGFVFLCAGFGRIGRLVRNEQDPAAFGQLNLNNYM